MADEELLKDKEKLAAGDLAAKRVILHSLQPSLAASLFYQDESDDLVDNKVTTSTSNYLWRTIKVKFGSTTGVRRELILEKFLAYTFKSSKTVTENLAEYTNLVREVEAAGSKFDDDFKCVRLVNALPNPWNAFKLAWAAQTSGKTLDKLIRMIQSEAIRTGDVASNNRKAEALWLQKEPRCRKNLGLAGTECRWPTPEWSTDWWTKGRF